MPLPSFTRSQLLASAPGGPCALTIGVMDGVHRGHQFLIGRVAAEARERGLTPGVVTLHPHPITVLRPDVAPSYLTSLEDRIALMLRAGAEWVAPLTFTSDVAEVPAEDLARAFFDLLNMRLLVLGPDAAFGRGAPRDTPVRMQALGKDLGFEVIQVEPFLDSGSRVSSTAIREALARGEMERVTSLLGRYYRLSGPIVHGFERGRMIGFPTANISVAADRAMPALGVYATRAIVGGHEYLGATNIGRRPTFDAGHVSIETYLLGFEGDIYGQRMDLDICHYLRGERAFAGVDELKAQIARDVQAAREALA